jgi:hypothetical protein
MPLNVDKLDAGIINQGGNPVKPYKVYTALLTQSGGSNILTTGNLNGGPSKDVDGFDIGVTYEITANPNNTNLTKYGATSNSVGTKFVSNYSGNLTDDDIDVDVIFSFNTGAPVVTVLENTIGNIYWAYEGTGQYSASVPNFIQGKGLVFYGAGNIGNYSYVVQAYNDFPSSGIWIDTSDSSIGSSVDGVLQETPIEIRVYN